MKGWTTVSDSYKEKQKNWKIFTIKTRIVKFLIKYLTNTELSSIIGKGKKNRNTQGIVKITGILYKIYIIYTTYEKSAGGGTEKVML